MATRHTRLAKQQATNLLAQKTMADRTTFLRSKRSAENCRLTEVPVVKKKQRTLCDITNKESFDKAVAKKQAIKKQQATGGQKRKTQVVIVPKSESRRTAASTAADVSWDVIELSQGSENSQPSQGSQKLTVSQASQVSQPSQGSQKLTVSQASQVSQPSQGSQKLTVSQASPVSKELTTSQKLAASQPSQKLTASQSSQEPNAANTSVDCVIENVQELNLRNSRKTKESETSDYIDIDAEETNDPFQVGLYAAHIFEYYKQREARFVLRDYLPGQPDLTAGMRAVLVDWLVEVQENFELNHETLYLAVKLVDHLLGSGGASVQRDRLQLIGAAALFSAAKFDEQCPPVVDDFLYICDGAYTRRELLETERKILRALHFDIGLPLSYRFLRRYAKCARASMKTLTHARYLLESSLLDYGFVCESDSRVAAAALLVALLSKAAQADADCTSLWDGTMRHYTGYRATELRELAGRLNRNTANPAHKQLSTIRTKYSHRVFSEVARITPLTSDRLDELVTLADKDAVRQAH